MGVIVRREVTCMSECVCVCVSRIPWKACLGETKTGGVKRRYCDAVSEGEATHSSSLCHKIT